MVVRSLLASVKSNVPLHRYFAVSPVCFELRATFYRSSGLLSPAESAWVDEQLRRSGMTRGVEYWHKVFGRLKKHVPPGPS
jgi:hypothetical protein